MKIMSHSIGFSGGVWHRSAKASRGEDLEIEQPVACWDFPSFHFHPALASVLGATLIRYEVVEEGEASEKRLLVTVWMMEGLHHKEFPVDGVMGLIQQGAGHGHPRVFEHRIPARLLVLKPLSHACAVGHASRVGDMVRKTTQLLAQREHPQAFPLARPVQQGVKLRAQGLADRRRDRYKFLRELVECVAQAVAEARPREQRPHTLGGAVEAISEDSFDPVQRLLLGCRTLKRPIGLGEGGGTGVLGIPQMPEHAAPDNRGEIHLVGETVTMLLITEISYEILGYQNLEKRTYGDILTAVIGICLEVCHDESTARALSYAA